MNRATRRANASRSRALQATRPERLTRQSEEKIRAAEQRLLAVNEKFDRTTTPLEVWESQEFLVQLYALKDGEGHDPDLSLRMTVCRTTLRGDGRANDNISWEDLQRIKREIGHGETYAIEVYPRDSDVVNVANMRHLWLFAKPLDCGWFTRRGVS